MSQQGAQMSNTGWNHLRLLGALFGLGMAALSVYTGRSDPMWGFIACGSFILATALHLESDQ